MPLVLTKPVMGPVTSPYGWRGPGEFHNGIDHGWLFAHPIKSRRIVSPAAGVVVAAGWDDVAGNYIVIRVDAVYQVRLMHMKSLAVSKGDRVWPGKFLGVMGATGSSTKWYNTHLHTDLYRNGVRVDPAPYIKNPYPGELSFAGSGTTPIVMADTDLRKRITWLG